MPVHPTPEPRRTLRSRRRLTCLLAGTAVASLTASALSTPADATTTSTTSTSSTRLSDSVGDVWSIGEGEGEDWVLAGDMPTADVVGAVVRHRPSRVVIRMEFADLRRVEPGYYAAAITTPDTFRGAFVSAVPGNWAGDRDLVNGRFGAVRCRGFRHSVDYAADRVSMSVPRTCLGRPRWVRVEMTNYAFRGDSEENYRELTDNPHTSGPDGGSTGRLHRAT